MENLNKAILALFTEVYGDDVLEKCGFLLKQGKPSADARHLDTDIRESELIRSIQEVDMASTNDQIEMLYQVIQNKWLERNKNCVNLSFHQSDSVFNALLHFSSRCLSVIDKDPVCRYRWLLRWHLLTAKVTEDLITTSFLAAQDLHWHTERRNFDWKAFIDHDNKEINSLLGKPLAELHMHLKGSSYNFDLSWICLMNNVWEMQHHFENVYKGHEYKKQDGHLYEKMKRAAAIRHYLAGISGCIPQEITLAQLGELLNNADTKRIKERNHTAELENFKFPDLQKLTTRRLHLTRKEALANFKEAKRDDDKGKVYRLDEKDIVDYIPVDHYAKEPVENKVMASERKFMYKVFRLIFDDKDNKYADAATLFYAYLLYKNYFRNEIIQLNDRTGFDNFASYEEQKTDYLLPSYNQLLYKAAIEGFLQKGEDRYIECRIVPKDTEVEIKNSLESISQCIDEEYLKHYGFIFHFIKKREERKEQDLYRHLELREEIKKKAYAIFRFRNNNEYRAAKNSPVGNVVGLDAANSEIYCRPEVFAQAFRFLRRHDIKINGDTDDAPDDLNVTYHVGEDFLDVADGLRAVNEAILFLNMRSGDRLGHALALGTDVRDYYETRYNSICISKQVILDNLAWLYHYCILLMGYTPLCGWLQMEFLHYFNDIYKNKGKEDEDIIASFFSDDETNQLSSDIDDYYLSWLLRGNSPTIGPDLDKTHLGMLTSNIDREWAYAGFNHHPAAETALRNSRARQLFDAYHSNKFYQHGDEADELIIPSVYREEWYTLLEKIQQDLLGKIERKHIAIECNPSSNYKIGEMKLYYEHPIFKFYNEGISTPYPHREITVSINTDDQGVFSTSLEREFSLVALALERNPFNGLTNTPRAVVEWLDRIREMGVEQKFVK